MFKKKLIVIINRSRIEHRKLVGITNQRWKTSYSLKKKLLRRHHCCREIKGLPFIKMTKMEIEIFKNEPRLRYKTIYKKGKV